MKVRLLTSIDSTCKKENTTLTKTAQNKKSNVFSTELTNWYTEYTCENNITDYLYAMKKNYSSSTMTFSVSVS
jgi:hypothetical protein